MDYDVIIGLEIHAEIKTKSKAFCYCSSDIFGTKANTKICPICLGHPGTLPLINEEAINKVILLGLALDCKINNKIKFDRKNYFYPDLAKGYQISQYDLPIAYNGFLEINKQKIEINRIHLEEDTAKLEHPSGKNYTLIDFNRSGMPLLELVTDPVIRDAATAKIFCQTFQQILKYLNISEANMEKGEMRCEANVSLQKKDSWFRDTDGKIKSLNNEILSNKVELKNINSFRSLERAISYEINRQSSLLDKGEKVLMETRGYDENKGETFHQRIKESGTDYRYFPEPDIVPREISEEQINLLKAKLVELPHKKKTRFVEQYGISPETAEIIVEDKDIANWMEMVISELREWISSSGESWHNHDKKLIKMTINWLNNVLFKFLRKDNIGIKDIKISAENFAELILLLHQEKINSSTGQEILKIMYETGGDPSNIMEDNGWEQKNEEDSEELEKIIDKIISEHQGQFEEFKNGKDVILQFFIGKVMAETKGRYNPKKIIEILNLIRLK